MKIKDVLQKKIGYFISEKYTEAFCEILRNIKEILIEDQNNKEYETIIQRFLKDKKVESVHDKINNYITSIEKPMLTDEYYLNYKFSKLEMSYLKYKAKLIRKKCKLLAIEYKKPLSVLIELYIRNCQKELKNSKYEPNILKRGRKKQNEEEEEDDERESINLFIGKFDYKKFLEQLQVVKMKKTGYVHAFIFQDPYHNTYENSLQTFKAPSKAYYKKKLLKRQNLKEKKLEKISEEVKSENEEKNNIKIKKIYIGNKIKTLISNTPISKSSKNNKKKLKILLTNEDHKINSYDNNNYTNSNINTNCNSNNYSHSKRKKINQSGLTESNHLPRINTSHSPRKGFINLFKKPSSSGFFLLKNKDLYY